MRDKDLYARILGIERPWAVSDVELDTAAGEVLVHVEWKGSEALRCPECDEKSPGYDRRERKWRHLDTCQYKTYLVAEVPRIECQEHGVKTIAVPWSEPGSRFTALFEALVIDWLKETTVKAVSRQLGLSWNAIAGIMDRAVKRGLARRKREVPTSIGVDETSFQRRHEYVTVVSAGDGKKVLYVADDRDKKALTGYYEGLTDAEKERIESVSMDMSPAYIRATEEALPDAREKIAFDKFHIAKHLGDAVDKVRRQEHRELQKLGRDDLTGRKYDVLRKGWKATDEQYDWLKGVIRSKLRTGRAWAIKEFGMSLWHYVTWGWAKRGWKRWLSWAMRCRLEPIKKVARMIKAHLWGVLNAVILKVNNAAAESINSRIQMIKIKSCGFRNRERFRNAIYFHLGGLDLYPAGISH